MRRWTQSALLAFALTWSAGASASGGPAAESDAAPQSVDRYALEQRVLQLMVEQETLQRREKSLWKAVAEEIDPETVRRFFQGGDTHTGIYVDQETMRVERVVAGSSTGHELDNTPRRRCSWDA